MPLRKNPPNVHMFYVCPLLKKERSIPFRFTNRQNPFESTWTESILLLSALEIRMRARFLKKQLILFLLQLLPRLLFSLLFNFNRPTGMVQRQTVRQKPFVCCLISDKGWIGMFAKKVCWRLHLQLIRESLGVLGIRMSWI